MKASDELAQRYGGTIGITRPGYEGEASTDDINFCPWCGAKIEYVEEKTVRRTEVPKQETITKYEYHDEEVTSLGT